jgi:glutamate-5-semialdehyde dehydrogenase
MTLSEQMKALARSARFAARALARLNTQEKNACLEAMARAIEENEGPIREANQRDLNAGSESGLSAAMLDRLKLDPARIASMARGLREVAALPDPVGRVLDERTRPNGLKLQKVSSPIGVVVIIYESRPNVTADAAGLCFKAGSACILRGGKEAIHSNRAIAEAMVWAAQRECAQFPPEAIQLVTTTDRDAIRELLAQTDYIDLCMPRGGEGLIRAVTECSKVPVIKHYKGVCHVFVDRDADLAMAENIVANAKCQRPATCNAMETLLVDQPVANRFLTQIVPMLSANKVEIRADPAAWALLQPAGKALTLGPATDADYATEYNDYILNVRVVDGLDQAIQHIHEFGSAHSDSIVSGNEAHARRFLQEVDSAAVYWNASTRFTDGGEFGMGAEIGISTDKVGARGPMGLEELTTYRWLGYGSGQIRK